MCERMIDVFAGKPDKFTTNLPVAAVMFLLASRVMSNVMVTLPLPPDSAFAIGGTSFAVRRSAVNVATLEIVGEATEVPPPQPGATRASARVEMVRRFIVFGSFVIRRTACELNPGYTAQERCPVTRGLLEQGRDQLQVVANAGGSRTSGYPDRKALRTASIHETNGFRRRCARPGRLRTHVAPRCRAGCRGRPGSPPIAPRRARRRRPIRTTTVRSNTRSRRRFGDSFLR